MKIIKRISLLLLLVTFIAPMGFGGLAFASKLNFRKVSRELAAINVRLDELRDEVQPDKLDEILGLLNELKDDIQPAWSKVLPAEERFVLVMNDEAVLDRETGLVWERLSNFTRMSWSDAIEYCYNREVGGRKGWRLPTVEELMSLIDRTQSNPALPFGHPFGGLDPDGVYWTATTVADSTYLARTVGLVFGFASTGIKTVSDGGSVWCVRGGYGYDGYDSESVY